LLTYVLTPWSRVLLQKLTGLQSRNSPHFMEPNVHYLIHKCLQTVPILSQLDPVHTPTSIFLKIHLNIILPSTPGSPKWSFFLKFYHQNPVHASPLPIRATFPVHLILHDFVTGTILGEKYRSLSSSLCSFLHYLVTSSLLGPNILLNTLSTSYRNNPQINVNSEILISDRHR